MATMGKHVDGHGPQSQRDQSQRGDVAQGEVGSPISNDAYNVVTALQAKLEGLEAYRKYAKGSNEEVWKELTRIETQGVAMLVDQLEQIVMQGQLRVEPTGGKPSA